MPEYALKQGVSSRRVLQLIEQGRVAARRSGGMWLIDTRELARRPLIRRPMSTKMAWGFIDLLSFGTTDPRLDPAEASRLRSRQRELRGHEQPARLLSAWLRSRCPVERFAVAQDDGPRLLGDPRFAQSGISDHRAGINAAGEYEGYVHSRDIAGLVREFLLVPSAQPNVLLHVVDRTVVTPVPFGLVVADLADRNGPREDAQVARLLERRCS